MKSPFQFGRVVEGATFTNRKDDINRLLSNFDSNVNTLILSPRRWGKTSLVRKAVTVSSAKNKKCKFIFIDLFNIRDEYDFYTNYAQEVIKVTSSKTEEWIKTAALFLKRISPRISVGIDPQTDFKISFDFEVIKNNFKDILNLPEKIAIKKKLEIIVCIDEFQNLNNFKESLLFQKRLRSAWQYHKNAAYCLYGSKRYMLMNLFENKSMPFYKFGDVFYMEKIEGDELVNFVLEKFAQTNKFIDKKIAGEIVDFMQCHPYYVQQLAHLTWINTTKKATESIFYKSVDDLLNQNSLLFEREIEGLSNTQVNFLKVISEGRKELLSSSEILNNYKLGSSANVVKIKKALMRKEIIDVIGSQVFFIDPAFELWFKKYFWK